MTPAEELRAAAARLRETGKAAYDLRTAAWRPAVSIAVADLLDGIAASWTATGADFSMPLPLAVARAFMGEATP